jgi:ribosome-binding protein aMBF1 (putative translation factor)
MRSVRGVRGACSTQHCFKVQLMATKKCPVCDWEIKDAGIVVKAGGKQLTVCCDDCAKKAKENPAQYAKSAK